ENIIMPDLKLLKIKSEMLTRKIGNKFGVDVKMTDEEVLLKQIKYNNVDLIFDIGANAGQFSIMLFKLGYYGKIVSFEPLSSAHEVLKNRSKKFSNWAIAERCAIGDTDGEIEINISKNSISSSALKILNEHVIAAPKSEYIGSEKVKVYKLDSIFDKYILDEKNIFIKIDTQGFEEKILNGASESIKKAKGLLVETSLVQLYEGQALFPRIFDRIIKQGFELTGIQHAFINKETGRVLQIDLIFFRV
ncbi:MAG: FkbM family methyltransferase, partial [Ignavibacteriae bacterium]|nr:FkbM family methyltransferase [Ignavibacteriota bacterium]